MNRLPVRPVLLLAATLVLLSAGADIQRSFAANPASEDEDRKRRHDAPDTGGSSFQVVPSPDFQGTFEQLYAVAANGANDVTAVGEMKPQGIGNYKPIAVHWNGSDVISQTVPLADNVSAELRGITTDTTGGYWATGYQEIIGQTIREPFYLHQANASAPWMEVEAAPVATPTNQFSISAASANDVWTAGTNISNQRYTAHVQHFDGNGWSAVPLPTPANSVGELLLDVTALGPDNVWFVGDYNEQVSENDFHERTLIYHWNGIEVAVVPSPNPGDYSQLYAISAVGPDHIWAGGVYSANGGLHTLTLFYNGSTWTQVPSPDVPGTQSLRNLVGSMWARASNDIWAATQASPPSIMHYDGNSWQFVKAQSTGYQGSGVAYDIDGPPGGDPWFAGFYLGTSLTDYRTLLERYGPCTGGNGCGASTASPTVSTPPQSTATPTITTTPISCQSETNVALAANGGTINSYSDNYGGAFDVTQLLDGSATTGWSTRAGHVANEWAIVDLGGDIQTIHKVRLNPSATGGDSNTYNVRNFEVRVSTTGTNMADFTTVISGTAPQQNAFFEYPIAAVPARYVMLFVVDNYGGNYIEAAEFEVYTCVTETPTSTATITATPTETTTPTPSGTITRTPQPADCNTNLARDVNGGAIAGFSSNYGGNWDVTHLIDGDPALGWATTSNNHTDAWVIVSLANGITYPINKVRLNPSATSGDGDENNLRNFEVRVSTTGTDMADFTMVISDTAPQENAFFEYDFAPVQAKYVMLYGVDSYGGDYIEVAEFEVYNCNGSINTPTPTLTTTAGPSASPTRTATPTYTPTQPAPTATPTQQGCVNEAYKPPATDPPVAKSEPKPASEPRPVPLQPQLEIIPGSPLSANVFRDGNYALYRNNVRQFYSETAEGVFLWINGKVWGPDTVFGGVPLGPDTYSYSYYNETLTGDGSPGDPWVATLVMNVADRIRGNPTGLQLTQRLTYVNGAAYMRNDWDLCSFTGTNYTNIHLFHAADLYTAGNDRGYGFYDAATGAVGGYNEARDNYQIFVPITLANHYEEDGYGTIWAHIGSSDAPGPGFDDSINENYVDNGAGLEWIFDLPAGACHTISSHISFSSQPVIPTPPTQVPGRTISPTATPTNPSGATATPTNPSAATATPTQPCMPAGTATPTRTVPPGSTSTPTRSRPTYTPAPTFTPGATNTPTRTVTPGGPTPPPCNPQFSDVRPSDYFYDPVRYLACRGAISGYADGSFRPYNNTTRSQLAKIVVGAENWPIITSGGPHFSDVPLTHPFYTFVETAVNHQIISGYDSAQQCAPNPAPCFKPFNDVTRGQVTKIISLAERWPLIDPVNPRFSDVSVDNPFYVFIETAAAFNVISGYDQAAQCAPFATPCFKWGANATRGQLSKIVYNAVTLP